MVNDALTPPTVYCKRGPTGNVLAITQELMSAEKIAAGQWQLAKLDDAQVNQFMAEVKDHANILSQTDTGLARVLEDLIDVLITRGVVQFTDLPLAAQAKLFERRETRANLADRLQLIPMDGESGLL